MTLQSGRNEAAEQDSSLGHGLRLMRGRNRSEPHRATTPLELLFYLTFAVAFGVTGAQFAQLLAEGHVVAGLLAFAVAMFAVV